MKKSHPGSVALLVAVLFSSNKAILCAANLVAHFPLDVDGNSTVGEFTASTVTDVEFGEPGARPQTGTSAFFNGSSSVIQHDWSELLNPESFTLALWVRSEGGQGTWNSPVTSRHDLFGQDSTSQGYLIYDNNPSGVWTFWSGNGDDPGNWQTLDGPPVMLGEWQHVAITYDNDLAVKKLYIDGELAVESDDTLTPNDTTPFNIGAGQDFGTGFWFNGEIDDIGLWDGALSAEEIAAIYNGTPVGAPPLDTDGDGMPDSWEDLWGFDKEDPADAELDADDDGDSNLAEFEMRTNPTDVTDPTLLSYEFPCSHDQLLLTFSETMDETSVSDTENYNFSGGVTVDSIEINRRTVTLMLGGVEPDQSYELSISGLIDTSKNTLADFSETLFSCTPITENILKFEAWFGISGASIDGLSDPRVPAPGVAAGDGGSDLPDFIAPVFSLNTRDAFPDNSNDNYAARMFGWITPTETASYNFYIRSDDASELWISTDDDPSNVEFQAEELDCCDPFQELGVDDTTTFAPLMLEAGQKYYLEARYKEGGGGDWMEVAWLPDGDTTPAASLTPIPGMFLSASDAVLAPANGIFSGETPAPNSANSLPGTAISVTSFNGKSKWTAENTLLIFDGMEVPEEETMFEVSGNEVTLGYQPSTPLASGTEYTVTIVFPDPAGDPTEYSWSFSTIEYAGPTSDTVSGYPGLITGSAVYTEDGGGASGMPGDFGMDFTGAGSIIVEDASWLDEAFAADELTVLFWSKKDTITNSSAFWILNSAGSGNRGFQAHAPWSDGQIYFDTSGCCAVPSQRLNGPVNTFSGFSDTFWDEWHLYSFSKSGGDKEVRIDGELFLEQADADPLFADVTMMRIGSDNGGGNNDLSVFDDFAIFTTALSESDVKAIAAGTSPDELGDAAGMIAYWDFNEGPTSSAPGSIDGIEITDGVVTITFSGTLQMAPSVDGPYSVVEGAEAPSYEFTPGEPAVFFIAE